MEEKIYLTNKKILTFKECEKIIDSGAVSSKNLAILANHVCKPELAIYIDSVTEQNGVLFININGEFIAIQ